MINMKTVWIEQDELWAGFPTENKNSYGLKVEVTDERWTEWLEVKRKFYDFLSFWDTASCPQDAKDPGSEADRVRLAREDRLRALGFEEPTPEQRKANLALTVALDSED
jgi:hypothetical protein